MLPTLLPVLQTFMPESIRTLRVTAKSWRGALLALGFALCACNRSEQSALIIEVAPFAKNWRFAAALSALPGHTCDTIYLAAPQPSCTSSTRVAAPSDLQELAAIESSLAARHTSSPTPESAHQLALVQLVAAADSVGVDRAIALLTEAVLAAPARAQFSNDLAATLLLRYSVNRRLPDLLQAAELASTFVNRDNPDRLSCWNAIVSLAWLSLRQQIARTRDHCERSCARLQCKLPVIIDNSPPLGTDERAIALSGQWPDAAWDYATTQLLPEWAQRFASGDSLRETTLRRDLLHIHQNLQSQLADSSIGHAISSISQARAGSERQRSLVRAADLYAQARRKTRVHGALTADAMFDSVATLTRASDELRLWAAMYRTNNLLTSGRSREALRAYRALGAGQRSPTTVLGGRLAFNEGLALMALGEQVSGLQRVELQAERCGAIGRNECALSAYAMAASIATLVGDDERSEQNTQRALERSVVPLGASRWSLLSVLRQTAEIYGHHTLSDLLHQEAVHVAQQLARPDLVAQELVLRAHSRSRQRDSAGLRRVIGSLDSVVHAQLAESDQRFYRAERSWIKGEYQLLTRQRGARALLDSSIALMASDTNSARQLRPRLSLARAIAQEGDTVTALRVLDSLLRSLEARSGENTSLSERVRLSESAVSAGEAAAELLRKRGDAEALLYALSARPFMAARLPTWDSDTTRLDLAARRLGDTVFVWSRNGGGWSVHRSYLPARTVHSAIRTLETSQLSTLFTALVAPALATSSRAVRAIRIDARGDLSDVSWAALFDASADRFLIERAAIWLTNDIGQRLTNETRLNRARVLVIDAAPRSGSRALPGAQSEVQRLSAVWDNQSEALDAAQGATQTLARMPAYEIVHFAGHAVLHPERPERSYLELPANGDTRITGVQVAAASFPRTALVVLAACDTRGGVRAGASNNTSRFGGGMLSLASAFREAGAKHVIGASWAIDDQATAAIMEQLHVALRGGATPAHALREAQLAGLRSQDPTRRSPRVWAAFQLLGS